jgi:hypothetical protein
MSYSIDYQQDVMTYKIIATWLDERFRKDVVTNVEHEYIELL